MSSSISSFKQTEWKVIAVIIAAVALLEVVARILAPHLDSASVHIHAFPEIVDQMQAGERPRVLVLGNSLLRDGAVANTILSELEAGTGTKHSLSKITPVSTAIVDWNYLYDKYFTAEDSHPDIVIVGFVAHHLPDRGEFKIRRLTRHFCSTKNLWRCLADELEGLEQRALGTIAHFSAIFGDQSDLQWYSIDYLIPEYANGVRAMNRFLNAKEAAAAAQQLSPTPAKTYLRLARLIDTFNAHGVRAYFVPMPQPEIWELDPGITATIEAGGAHLIDARAIDTITPEDFRDGYHLGDIGTEKFSLYLARKLAANLSPPSK